MTLYREARCPNCGASVRQSDVARTIMLTLARKEHSSLKELASKLSGLSIYEADSTGAIHEALKRLPNYVCSEYMDGVKSGDIKNGVRCENLAHLTFKDNSFDLVITQDVLEHVSDPEAAFCEIRRVLKPEGHHVFTVPVHEGRKTSVRAKLVEGHVTHLMPAVHHGDPLRTEGALVFTDFGDDIASHLGSIGMRTECIKFFSWYSPNDITFVTEGNYSEYLEAYRNAGLASFFKYNSVVLTSKKITLPSTGERYVPGVEGLTAYEHLHRYAIACDYANGKTVLDIATGEGYGSCLLARKAKRVVGVDISEESIAHAREKYAGYKNLDFVRGSCTDIPFERETFDMVVSFETIEHLAEHDKMLEEIKRVLKKDGLLIISSPNKDTYKEFKNKFHVKELTLEEFLGLLKLRFRRIKVMGQRLTFSSCVWQLDKLPAVGDFVHYSGDASRLMSSLVPPFEALYYIAFCSDADDVSLERRFSLFTDKSDFLYQDYNQTIPALLNEKNRQIRRYRNSYSWKMTAPLRFIVGLFEKRANHIR